MSRLSAIILGTTIAIVQPQIAWAENVVDIAKEITVKIDGCSSGSGVIFHKEGNTYHVLTAYHVVDEYNNFCLVITPDKERHEIESANIQPLEGLDLAVVKFVSNNSYRRGKLGNSQLATMGTTVYVAGYPPSKVSKKRTQRVTEGKIIGRADEAEEGYTLIYDNTTRKGMSGGPVLNVAGEIIGIHGKGDLEDGSKENYGIPIEKFQEARGSRFWQIPSFPERRDDVDESGEVEEGLSWPLILLGGLAILGGGAGLLSLGYLFGSRTQSKNNPKVSYSPSPEVNSASRSEPVEPTILHVDHPEVTAQPEEPVPARYQKLRDLLAAGEWKKADQETAQVMLQVAGLEKEGCFTDFDITYFPGEDLLAIDKLWVKYSNGRFGFSVQKRIWLEVGALHNYETECRLGDRVGWRVMKNRWLAMVGLSGKEWLTYDNLTFSMAAPTGHLPSGAPRWETIRIRKRSRRVFSRVPMCVLVYKRRSRF